MNQRLPYTAWAKKAKRLLRDVGEDGEPLYSLGCLVDSDEEGKAIYEDTDLARTERGEPGTYVILKNETGAAISECIIGGAIGSRTRMRSVDAQASLSRSMSAQNDGWALLTSAHERALTARDKSNEDLRKENDKLREELLVLKKDKIENEGKSPELVIAERAIELFSAWVQRKESKDDIELLREFTEHLVQELDPEGQAKAIGLLNAVQAGKIQ